MNKLPKSKKIILIIFFIIYCMALLLIWNNFGDRNATRNITMILIPAIILFVISFYLVKLSYREIGFVLIILTICYFVIEISFSIYLKISPERASVLLWGHSNDLGDHFVYRPHHYTLFTLKEGYRNDMGTAHNNQGFRNNKDIFIKKRKNEFRIFFIGGSTTYTIGIKDNHKIFTSKLEKALNNHAREGSLNIRARVINAGMGAATSAENLSRLIFHIIQYKPDLVVIQHGLNDVWPRLRGDIKSDYSNYRRMWCSNRSEYNFALKTWIYKHIMSKSNLLLFLCIRLNLLEPNTIRGVISNNRYEEDIKNLKINSPDIFQRNTELMVLVSKYAGSDVLLVSCPYTKEAGKERLSAMPKHNQIMKLVAQKMGAYFFDLYGIFDKSIKNLPDGIHASQRGSDLKYELYLKYLLESYNIFGKRGDLGKNH